MEAGKTKKVVIVGGVASGATLATRLRRLDESMHIMLLERGEYISFANCGLPYHIGNVIPERESLLVQTPEAMRARFNIDVRTGNEVVAIDRQGSKVLVKDVKSGDTREQDYDVLVLATGAAPLRPRIPGIESPRVLSLRSMADMDRIIERLKQVRKGRAVVVGGGFIGLEMAENLHRVGCNVTIVEMAEQVMLNLDAEIAAVVHHHLRENGVNLLLGDGVARFHDEGGITMVGLQSGIEVRAGIVIFAAGVRPEATLARDAGLATGPRGGILVDSKFRTQDPHIFAIGDAAEIAGPEGKPRWVPLAGPANRQARLLADYLAGRDVEYRGAQGTSIAKVFDLVAASTGSNERALREQGARPIVSITHSHSSAGYYPGASTLTIKLVFDSGGRILGAQAVGRQGVDKRIDVIAAAMRLGATVRDLADLELAYAPPFGSAKDPVNIAGYVATNILDGDMPVAYWDEVKKAQAGGSFILDVREPEEYKAGHIKGAVNIPLDDLRSRLDSLPKDREIIAYCRAGQRAWNATRILAQNGFAVKNLAGGWLTYERVTADRDARPGAARSSRPRVDAGTRQSRLAAPQQGGRSQE